MLFTYSICISTYTVSLEMHNLYKWYTTPTENKSLFSEENKNLLRTCLPNFLESHLHKNLFRLTWKNLGSYKAGFYCIIFLFSPVTANAFFSDENDLITCPRFWRESYYFNMGLDCFQTWINLFLLRNQFKRSQNARFPLASGSSSQEFFEHSRHVLRSWYKVGGPDHGFPSCFADGHKRRLSLKCFADYI